MIMISILVEVWEIKESMLQDNMVQITFLVNERYNLLLHTSHAYFYLLNIELGRIQY